MLFLKKLVSRILFPMPFALLLAALGLYLAFWKKGARWNKCGKWLLVAVFAGMFLASSLGTYPLIWLERRSKAIETNRDLNKRQEYTICVFGSAYVEDAGLPKACSFNESMLIRLGEAARLAHEMEKEGYDYKVVVSMQSLTASREIREESVKAFFALYSIPEAKVGLLKENCHNSRLELAGFQECGGRLLLVSHAWHVVRIKYLAGKMGIDCIPAPAGFHQCEVHCIALIPSGDNLNNLRIFVYETLGLLEYAVF